MKKMTVHEFPLLYLERQSDSCCCAVWWLFLLHQNLQLFVQLLWPRQLISGQLLWQRQL